MTDDQDAAEGYDDLRELAEDDIDIDAADWSAVGQLVDPNATSLDDEEELIAEEVPGEGLSPEEAAMHVEPER